MKKKSVSRVLYAVIVVLALLLLSQYIDYPVVPYRGTGIH